MNEVITIINNMINTIFNSELYVETFEKITI
jgi:hypothetical protein